jgi:16S rRNA (uracil1498-N3)-methyltransferase
MARRLFFVPEVHSGAAELRGEEAKHLTRVLRVERGQLYEISDNQHKYLAEVTEAHKEGVRFAVREKLAAERETPEITLYAAIIKFEHFEWGIEKAVELGVDRIIPVLTARVEKGLDRAVPKRLERWRRIALEASQQCRRAFLPEIRNHISFRQALKSAEGVKYFLDEDRSGAKLHPAAELPVAVLAGPEGGWTGEERSQAKEAGWTAVSLGPRVLRAETAWLTALARLRI